MARSAPAPVCSALTICEHVKHGLAHVLGVDHSRVKPSRQVLVIECLAHVRCISFAWRVRPTLPRNEAGELSCGERERRRTRATRLRSTPSRLVTP